MKILIVDDEPNILEIVDAYLVASHYTVVSAQNGKIALQKFEEHAPDLVVLDLMLPDIDGLSVAKKIRETSDTPIIMLTAKSKEADILAGLHLGADDYVVKPFSPKELVARIETVLRRVPKKEVIQKLTIDQDLIIHVEARRVFKHNIEIKLTTSEFNILYTLANTPNKVFSRSDLIESVKGYDFSGFDRSIDSHVKNLRHKIEPNPKEPKYILTVHGVGYRFGRDLK